MDMITLVSAQTGAYIDPASVSILLTSISGIVIAVGAAAIILWRKAKKAVAKTLHIDENANKEVEEDVVINEDPDEEELDEDDEDETEDDEDDED